MNVVDIVIGVILLIGLVSGLARGFTRTLFGLAALVLGIVAAGRAFAYVAKNVLFFLPGERVSEVAGFVLIFLIVFFAIVLIGRLIAKALKLALLGGLDRLAGGLLGLIMASVWTGVFLLLAVMGGFHEGRALVSSKLAPQVFGITDAIVTVIPEDVRSSFDENYKRLRDDWEKAKVRKRTRLALMEAAPGNLSCGSEIVAT
jgi:membrane protein required for colicin V production